MHGPTCIFWANLTPFSLKAGGSWWSRVISAGYLGGGGEQAPTVRPPYDGPQRGLYLWGGARAAAARLAPPPACLPGFAAAASCANQPTDQPTDPTDRPANQPTDRPTDQPTDRPTDRPTGRPTDRPTDRPTSQPTNRCHPALSPEPSAGQGWAAARRW
jgi:hypothetical protein